MESRKKDLKSALPAPLIRPEPYHTYRGHQHDVVGHRGAKLVLQVLHSTAPVIDGDKVALALI